APAIDSTYNRSNAAVSPTAGHPACRARLLEEQVGVASGAAGLEHAGAESRRKLLLEEAATILWCTTRSSTELPRGSWCSTALHSGPRTRSKGRRSAACRSTDAPSSTSNSRAEGVASKT